MGHSEAALPAETPRRTETKHPVVQRSSGSVQTHTHQTAVLHTSAVIKHIQREHVKQIVSRRYFVN